MAMNLQSELLPPLRIIISRQIDSVETLWGSHQTLYQEVLECGHPYAITPLYAEQFTAKRRRCPACGHGLMGKPAKHWPTENEARVAEFLTPDPLKPPPQPVAKAKSKKASA